MKKSIITVFIAAAATTFGAAAVKPAIPYDAKLEARVNEIVGNMTLEEKVGQMCELTVDMVTDFQGKKGPQIDKNKLKWAFEQHKVGSILNVPFGGAQTPAVYRTVIKEIQDASMKYIGIPDIYGMDEIHGTTYTAGGTLFPQEVNMAASFNRQLTNRIGIISAYETRASSIPWSYAPVMDVARNPSWYSRLGELWRRPIPQWAVGTRIGTRYARQRSQSHRRVQRSSLCKALYGLWCSSNRQGSHSLLHNRTGYA